MDSTVSIFIKGSNLTGGMWSGLRSQIGAAQSSLDRLRGNFNAVRDSQSRFLSQRNDYAGLSNGIMGVNASILTLTASLGAALAAWNAVNGAAKQAISTQSERILSANTIQNVFGVSASQADRFVQSNRQDVAKLGRDLPAESRTIQSIQDAIIDNYAKTTGNNLDLTKRVTQSVAVRAAILAQGSGVNAGLATQNIQSYLAGESAKSLTFFGRNAGVLNLLEQYQKAGDSRELALVKALEGSLTQEQIKKLQGTVSAQLSSISDTLFDPEVGLFSFARDLEPKIEGYQTVIDEAGSTLDILFGNSGIFPRIATLTGLNKSDPIRSLYNGVQSLNSYLLLVSNSLNQMKKLSASDIGSGVGKFLAQGVNVVFDGVLGGLKSMPYKDILLGVGSGVASFFSNLDWKVYATGAGVLLAASLLGAVVPVVGVVAAGTISAVAGAFIGFPFLVAGAIALGLIGVARYIQQNWDAVNTGVNSAFKSVYEVVEGAISKVEDALRWLFTSIEEKVRGLFTGVTDNVIKPVIGGAANVVQNTGNVVSSGASAVGNFFSGVGKFFGFGAAGGYIPASMGLMGAIASEASRKPANSDFVIANSSETILTPNQLTNLMGNLGGKSVHVGAININANFPSGTPQQIAMEAIDLIERSLVNELETRIA